MSVIGLNLSWNNGTLSAGAPDSSNLVRLRNSSLGKSAPLLSTNAVSVMGYFIVLERCSFCLKQKEITKIKCEKQIPYGEARQIVERQPVASAVRPGVSYAKVSNPPHQLTARQPPQKIKRTSLGQKKRNRRSLLARVDSVPPSPLRGDQTCVCYRGSADRSTGRQRPGC